MKVILIALLFNIQCLAVEVEIVDRDSKIIFSGSEEIVVPQSLGDISVSVLNKNGVTYVGGNFGFSSIHGIGNELELISDTEMKAHGWCFSVDGVVPDTMADATIITHQETKIRWFYSYAHYKDGVWFGQCEANQ